jgi:hypothetical protein
MEAAMHRKTTHRTAGFALALALLAAAGLRADPGDTTWVHTLDREFYNWATAHVDTFDFPTDVSIYSDVILFYTIECPESPDDCDPWDRLGWIQVLRDTGEVDSLGMPIEEPVEIARVITPYDITGGTRPGSCAWPIDVSDYITLLQGSVVLKSYISSWIGGTDGWLVTVDFAFVEGSSGLEPYRVVNLWQDNGAVFGDPDVPIEAFLHLMKAWIDPDAVSAKVRVIVTGHGQGNTDNCAEFCPKEHTLLANGTPYTFTPWRDDCNLNTCSPQGGTWQYNRAGWCPGDKVDPHDFDITGVIVPGDSVKLNYDIEPYENFCRPTNPDCVDGVTCFDCDYNSTGHTQPYYAFQSQLILYRERPVGIGEPGDASLPRAFALGQNYPNPFNPVTTIAFEIPDDAGVGVAGRGGRHVVLDIFDVRGRRVRRLVDAALDPGRHEIAWDGRDGRGDPVPSGVYIYSLRAGDRSAARKMILLK